MPHLVTFVCVAIKRNFHTVESRESDPSEMSGTGSSPAIAFLLSSRRPPLGADDQPLMVEQVLRASALSALRKAARPGG